MDEQKIREAAYQLWEKDGKPQGQELEHWFTAEKSAGEEDLGISAPGSMKGSEADPSQSDSSAEDEDQNNDGR